MTLNPRCGTIGEEHGDEDYTEFWNTFSHMTAEEVLHAVYAIRAGALDIPDTPCRHDDMTWLAVFCCIWAIASTLLSICLYFLRP